MMQRIERGVGGEDVILLEKLGRRKDAFIICSSSDITDQEEKLYRTSPTFRGLFSEAEKILGVPIADFRFRLKEYSNSLQVRFISRFLYNYVCVTLPQRDSLYHEPEMITGDTTIGFINALVHAGSITFAEGLQFVSELANIYDTVGQTNPGVLFDITLVSEGGKTSESDLDNLLNELIKEKVYLSRRISNSHIVVGGAIENIEKVKKQIIGRESPQLLKTTPYGSLAYHTPLMEEAVSPVITALSEVNIQNPKIPVVALTTGEKITTREEIEIEIIAQITQPLLINEVRKTMRKHGIPFPLEIASGVVETLTDNPMLSGVVLLAAAGGIAILASRQKKRR